MRVESTVLQEKLQDNDYDIVVDNFPRQLEEFKMKLKAFFRRSIKYRRQVATHALVVMISPEQRAKKPCALPVQCLSCNMLKDEKIRSIIDDVIEQMAKKGMKVAGKWC